MFSPVQRVTAEPVLLWLLGFKRLFLSQTLKQSIKNIIPYQPFFADLEGWESPIIQPSVKRVSGENAWMSPEPGCRRHLCTLYLLVDDLSHITPCIHIACCCCISYTII
jgi:hypothetical protein